MENTKKTKYNGIVNEISLKYDPRPVKGLKSYQLRSPDVAAAFFRKIWDPDLIHLKESFYILLLNNGKRVIGYYHVSTGNRKSSVVDPADVIRVAILTGANSVILCHNHPSGTLDISKADIHVTEKIISAAKYFDIDIDDHIILTDDGFTSMVRKGIM